MTGFKTTRSHGIRQAKQTLTTQARRRKPGGQFLPGLDNLRFLRTRLSGVGQRCVQPDESAVSRRWCATEAHTMRWKHGIQDSKIGRWKLTVSLSPTLVPRVSPRGGVETENSVEKRCSGRSAFAATTASAVLPSTLLLLGAQDVHNNPCQLTLLCTSCAHTDRVGRWAA